MRDLFHFFNNVMIRLSNYGWQLRIVPNSSEGYCWKRCKVIDIGANNVCPKELILHEIAHIATCRFCNNRHHLGFWRRYRELMRKFLPKQKLSLSYNKTFGFFRKCYDNESRKDDEKVRKQSSYHYRRLQRNR